MAFQMVLRKLEDVEQAMGQMLPLLTKIVTLLETKEKPAEVPVAAFTQIYPEMQAETEVAAPPLMTGSVPPPKPRGFLGWFTRETAS